MHVCSIITSYTAGGAEVIAANLSDAFVKAGHRSTMLALCDAVTVGNPAEYERTLMRRIANGGGHARSLQLRNRRNMLAGALAMRRVIGDIDPDVIHVHTAQALILLLFAGVRRPTVYTHHNIRFNFPLWLFRLFDRITDRYVAIGEVCGTKLRAMTRKPVVLIRNGVPAGFADSRQRSSLAHNPVLLSVGALTSQKDYPVLIRAAAIVVRAMGGNGRKPHFRVAGDGAEMAPLRALVGELGLEGHVELLGTRQDVSALMQQADLMVNSSLFEGLPIALVEAAMSGLPIVATEVGGNGEVVEPGLNGLLVPPSDPGALASAILTVLDDEAGYRAMSRASLRRSRGFMLENCAAAHLKLYAEICRPAAGPQSPAKADKPALSTIPASRKYSRRF